MLRALVSESNLGMEFDIDSAGTHAYHVGEPPDPRSMRAAAKRGIDISRQQARAVKPDDFECFDYILAMDSYNLSHLRRIKPADARTPPRP